MKISSRRLDVGVAKFRRDDDYSPKTKSYSKGMISPTKENSLEPGLAFGVAFREARVSAELTQEQVAHSAGLDRTYISLIERGKRQPTVRVVFQLAAAVGTTATALIISTEELVTAS